MALYVGQRNKEGKRHGHGRETSRRGDVYDGMWENDMREGKGIMTFHNGDFFDGDFREDEPGAGKAKLTYKEYPYPTAKYDGEVINGYIKHGKGIMTLHNGDFFDGDWREDEPGTGKAKVTNHMESGAMYEGEVINGYIPHGKGIVIYPGGDIYDGMWKKGTKEGKGTFTSGSEDGTDIYKVQWKNDILTWWSDKSCNGIEDPVSYESIPEDRGFRLQAEKVKDENGHYNKGRCYDAETILKIKNNKGPFSRKKFTNIDKRRREGYEEYVKRKNKKQDFPSYRPSPSAKSAPNMSTRSKRTNSARIFSRPSSANIFSKSNSARRSAKSLGGRRRRRSSTRVIQ